MVSRSDGPFALSGAVSLAGAPLPACPHRAETLFYGRTACVFRTGASRELHVLREGPGLLALFGRTFSPFAVHPGAPDLEAKLARLEAGEACGDHRAVAELGFGTAAARGRVAARGRATARIGVRVVEGDAHRYRAAR